MADARPGPNVRPVRLVTWNVNGIRAATKNGLVAHVDALRPDALLLQEVRARPDQMAADHRVGEDLEAIWHPAERPGYSGVLTAVRGDAKELSRGIDTALDATRDPEGRVLAVQRGDVAFVNVYLPNGSSSPERQSYKDAWCRDFLGWLRPLARKKKPVLVAGDLNVAHTEDDIWDPRGNKETSGFLPHEREWFTALLASGWTDLVRAHRGPGKGPYSWWSQRGRARAEDRGWRIDYVLANRAAAERLCDAAIDREKGLAVSDHAPVIVDLQD